MKEEYVDHRKVLNFAAEMGQTLLASGAEIFRVEETIGHICKYYKVEDATSFVMSNGIFLTAKIDGKDEYARVKYIPSSAAHLGMVSAVNDLSRRICAGALTLDEGIHQLEQVKQMPKMNSYVRILAAGIGSASFCYLLEGTFLDSGLTLIISMTLYLFILFCEKYDLSNVVENTIGGAIVSILAVGLYVTAGDILDMQVNKVIIGSILPMVPGVAFVNSIRDIANKDVLSGLIKLFNSLLVFVYIAIGVGTVLSLFTERLGGLIL